MEILDGEEGDLGLLGNEESCPYLLPLLAVVEAAWASTADVLVVDIALAVHEVGMAVVGIVPVVVVSLEAAAAVLRPEADWLDDIGLAHSHGE